MAIRKAAFAAFLLGALTAAGAVCADVEFPPLDSRVEWLKSERIRGTLFHQLAVSPMFDRHLLRPAEIPAEQAPPFDALGETYVVLLPDHGVVKARIEAVRGAGSFPQSNYALFDESGRELKAGVVDPGRYVDVSADKITGPCTLLVNSGPSLRNTARIHPQTHFWAIDARSHSSYDRTPLHYNFLRDLKLGSFNLVLADFESLDDAFYTVSGLASWSGKVKKWTDYARKVGLRIMPSINLGGSQAEVNAWGDARPGLYVSPKPSLPVAPCPLDRRFWERVYLSRGREVARLSVQNPFIVGFSLDPEMYQCWIYGHYMMTGTCFCDYCLGNFLRSQSLPTDILSELRTGRERYDWLMDRDLYSDYDRYLEDRMTAIARWCRIELQKINPNFLPCMFVMEIGNWFCRGMARGLGRDGVPAINFAEYTYYGVGYDPAYLEKTVARFRQWGARVVMGSAVWDRYFPATEARFAAAHCYNLATRCQGYFYWPGDHLYEDWGSESAFYNRVAWWDDYGPAMALTNQEISLTMADPGRASPLDDYAPVPWKDAWDYENGGWDIDRNIARLHSKAALALSLAAPTTLFFDTSAFGQFVFVRARTRQMGSAAFISLVDPHGATVASGEVGWRNETSLQVNDAEAGIWKIVIGESSQGGFAEVEMDFDAGDTYLCTSAQSLLHAITKPPGLIGHWPLDEGKGPVLHDTSRPPHFNGFVEGAAWTDGLIGKALKFDGRSGSAEVVVDSNFHRLRQFSLSACVKFDALPTSDNGATILNKGPESPVQHVWWWIGYPPDYCMVLEMGNEKHVWGTGFWSGPLNWEIGKWYHLMTTFSREDNVCTVRQYRDGQLVAESRKRDDLHSGNYNLLIGTYGGMHWLNGSIDDVKFYNVALSPEYVRSEAARRDLK